MRESGKNTGITLHKTAETSPGLCPVKKSYQPVFLCADLFGKFFFGKFCSFRPENDSAGRYSQIFQPVFQCFSLLLWEFGGDTWFVWPHGNYCITSCQGNIGRNRRLFGFEGLLIDLYDQLVSDTDFLFSVFFCKAGTGSFLFGTVTFHTGKQFDEDGMDIRNASFDPSNVNISYLHGCTVFIVLI